LRGKEERAIPKKGSLRVRLVYKKISYGGETQYSTAGADAKRAHKTRTERYSKTKTLRKEKKRDS